MSSLTIPALFSTLLPGSDFGVGRLSSAQTVRIDLDDRSYPISIGADLLGAAATYAVLPKASAVLIVTNTTVAPLYADALRAALAPNYAQVHLVALPDGEEHKN